jgi:hypothetical protein
MFMLLQMKMKWRASGDHAARSNSSSGAGQLLRAGEQPQQPAATVMNVAAVTVAAAVKTAAVTAAAVMAAAVMAAAAVKMSRKMRRRRHFAGAAVRVLWTLLLLQQLLLVQRRVLLRRRSAVVLQPMRLEAGLAAAQSGKCGSAAGQAQVGC